MNKFFTSLAVASMVLLPAASAKADEGFVVPEPTVIVPIGGVAELLYNMASVTWGYYTLVENTEDMTVEVTYPDGSTKTCKAQITDANGTEGEGALDEVPAIVQNALMITGIGYDAPVGTYYLDIREGMVLVNGVENPAATLSFKIIGLQPEDPAETMGEPLLIFPTSFYNSYLSLVELTWYGEKLSFVDDVESVTLEAMLDGVTPVSCTATIQTITDSGSDDSTPTSFDVLYISFKDFLSYQSGTILDLTIPEGLIKNEDNKVNAEEIITFTLLEQIEGTVSPEEGTELQEGEAALDINWEGLTTSYIGGQIVARLQGGNYDDDIPVEVIFAESTATISLDLSSLPVGNYEIIVPESYVLIMTEENIEGDTYAINAAMTLYYSITEDAGVESISINGETNKVFSIDGMKVLDSSDNSKLNELNPGIYIINGKKYIKR